MIDNPLPDQVMEEKQRDSENELFKEYAYKEAEELCSDHGVWDQFRESFKEWLSNHNLNATKVFGTKVTFEKMKQAAGLFTSIVGIVLYVLLREELRGML